MPPKQTTKPMNISVRPSTPMNDCVLTSGRMRSASLAWAMPDTARVIKKLKAATSFAFSACEIASLMVSFVRPFG